MAKVSENIFNKTECIDFEKLVAYSKSELSKADTRIVEDHLSSCAICSDIIDGLNEMPETLNLKNEISILNKKLEDKIVSHQKGSNFKSKIKFVAAAIIVVLVISSIIMINYKPPQIYYTPNSSDDYQSIQRKKIGKAEEFIEESIDTDFIAELTEEINPQSLKSKNQNTISNPVTDKIELQSEDIIYLEDSFEFEISAAVSDEKSAEDFEDYTQTYAKNNNVLNEIVSYSGEAGQERTQEKDDSPTGKLVFSIAETYPEFLGGETEMQKFIKENLIYPEDALQKKIEGKIYVQCTIDKNGKINNPEIAKGISESLNAEALRLVKLMPKFAPAMQDSKPIEAKYVIVIEFELPF